MIYQIYGCKKEGYILLKKVLNEVKLVEFVSKLNLKKYYSILVVKSDNKNNMDETFFYESTRNDVISKLNEITNDKPGGGVFLQSEQFFMLFLAFLLVRGYTEVNLNNIGFVLYKYLLNNEYVELLSDFEISETSSLETSKVIKKLTKNNYIKKINDELYIINISLEEAGSIINSISDDILTKIYDLINIYEDEEKPKKLFKIV